MIITEIAARLGAQVPDLTYSTSAQGNVFLENLQSSPDTAVLVRSTGGKAGDGTPHQSYNFQIITRGIYMLSVAQMADEIYQELQYMNNESIVSGGSYCVYCKAVQDAPVYLGQDAKRRHEYSQNFEILVSQTFSN